jgi:hypothetical protein
VHGLPFEQEHPLQAPPGLRALQAQGPVHRVRTADRDQFRAWTRDAADVRDRTRSERGLAELFGYGQQLVARKRAQPGDNVISRLCATAGTGDDEIAMLSMFLLFAGHETTVAAIGTGTLLLLTHAAQWQALGEDLALVPAASATARATVSARRWPASSCRPSSPGSSRGSRQCAWPCPRSSSRSTATR